MTQDVIFLILFVLPGWVAQWAAEMTAAGTTRKRSETQVVAALLLASLPATLLTWLIVRWFYPGLCLEQLKDRLAHPGFVAGYMAIALALGALGGYIWPSFEKNVLLPLINKLRKKRGLPPRGDEDTLWGRLLTTNRTMAAELIMPNGEHVKGWVRRYSMQEREEREIILDELRPGDEEFLEKVRHVYVDTKSGIIVKEYELSAYGVEQKDITA